MFRLQRILMAPIDGATDGAAGGGAGDGGGDKGSTDGAAGAAGTDGAAGADGTDGTVGPIDLAARLAAAESTIEKLALEKAAADDAAEAARVAALSDAERLAEDRAALSAEIEQGRESIRKEAQLQALARLGVLPAYHETAPAVDVRTTEGAATLEAWARARPEIIKQTPGEAAPYVPAAESLMGKVLRGVVQHPYISAEGVRKLLH